MPADATLKTQPLVSVVIGTLNRAKFLERCVRSVLDQTYRNIECIVMDGASKDGSVEILKRLADSDPRLKYVSEPDDGEVDAVNKGIDLVSGEILGFQSSDDYYLGDAIESAVRFLMDHPEFACVGGDTLFIDADGNNLGSGMFTYRGKMSKETIHRIIMFHHVSPLYHGSSFGWRKRLLAHGKFDPRFSVSYDYDFYLRLLSHGEQIGCLPKVQLKYTLHPDMGAIKFKEKVKEQCRQIRKVHGFKPYQELARIFFSRPVSYLMNPYRPPISSVLKELPHQLREFGDWFRDGGKKE